MGEARGNPHNAPGSGSGKTRRRNARRRRKKEAVMATTIMMDDFAFERLPDRQRLTGAPLLGQDYRDGDDDDSEYVYRWTASGWVALARTRPAP